MRSPPVQSQSSEKEEDAIKEETHVKDEAVEDESEAQIEIKQEHQNGEEEEEDDDKVDDQPQDLSVKKRDQSCQTELCCDSKNKRKNTNNSKNKSGAT